MLAPVTIGGTGTSVETGTSANTGYTGFVAGEGNSTLVGGSGAATVTGGSGHDVFGFVEGHAGGTITIDNFNSTDNLPFGGYGYTLANAPTETVINGNDVLALSDGTQITFTGIDHKIF